jgi:NAD(P)-dependent dehydrogenase (short-subunit alcohol dehydrogenase family)
MDVEIGTVLVTGGASGLGRAVADAVAKAGGTPAVLDRAEPASLARDYAFEQVDLADTRAAEAAVRRVAGRLGGLDAVVTAAGTDACGDFEEVAAEAWERVVAVNLLGTAAVIRAALPFLERRGEQGAGQRPGQRAGRVVTVASTLGLRALPAATAYCASKFGVIGFSRALAVELAGRVGVTCLVPGGMSTAFFDGRPERFKPAPDQRLNRPEDVAETVMFALRQPLGCEVRELVVTPSVEPSWP